MSIIVKEYTCTNVNNSLNQYTKKLSTTRALLVPLCCDILIGGEKTKCMQE